MRGDPLGVLYLEPSIAGADALAPLVGNGREVNGALVGNGGEAVPLRSLYERRQDRDAVIAGMSELLVFAQRRTRRTLDPRVAQAVETIAADAAGLTSVAQIAASVGLSASRFQCLFSSEVGVPYRRYRGWHRLRSAIREVTAGSNYTAAAHSAGFADQAHFTRDFRRTFGAPPSRGL
jgi:AraC-like DNA-binding protein